MKMFKKLRFLRLAHHIIKHNKTEELKNLPRPVKAEDMDQETRQNMIDNWNKHVERQNKAVEKKLTEVDRLMKKKAKLFDKALFEAVKSGKKYLYVKNHTKEFAQFKFEYKITNHSRGIQGFKRIKLKSVRKNMIKDGVDYENMTVGQMYETITKKNRE